MNSRQNSVLENETSVKREATFYADILKCEGDDQIVKRKLMKVLCDDVLSGLSADQATIKRKYRLDAPKIRDEPICPRKKQIDTDDMGSKKIISLIETQKYLENQMSLLRKRLRDEKFGDLNLSCRNVINYLKKHVSPHRDFYLFYVYLYWTKSQIGMNNMADAHKYFLKTQKYSQGSYDLEIEHKMLHGEFQVAKGRYHEAARIWQELIEKLENEERVQFLEHELAQCLFEAGDLVGSANYAARCVSSKHHPWCCNGLLLLGQIAALRGDGQGAINKFVQAKKLCEKTQNPAATANYIAEVIDRLQQEMDDKNNKY